MKKRVTAFDSYPTLLSIGFHLDGFGRHRRSDYWIMETPNGRKNVKVVPRKFNTDNYRYFIGIAYRLLEVVDLWIIWCESEPFVYAIPDTVMQRIWDKSRRHTSQSDQFDFNFHLDTGRVEHPMASLREYRIDLNAEVA